MRKWIGWVIVGVFVLAGWATQAEAEFINHPPVADANGPYIVRVGESLLLDGSGSYDIDTPYGDYIVSRRWSLDQTSLSTFPATLSGETLTVSAATLASYGLDVPGLYYVGHQVTDSLGETDQDYASLVVQSAVPEPASLALLALGGGLLLARRRIGRR